MPPIPFYFASESWLAIAVLMGVAITVILIGRGIIRRGIVRAFLAAGLALLILATGRPFCFSNSTPQVAVVVDLSVSTRGASFLDDDLLRRRVSELLGQTPYTIIRFNDHFRPPTADAVLLFSSGRFSPPSASPPVYPVLDPSLECETDAAIAGMRLNGTQLQVSVSNDGPQRTLTMHGVLGLPDETIESDQTVTRTINPRATTIWAELSGGDLWPENDRASIRRTSPIHSQRWWVGSVWPDDFRALTPEQLPTDPADYLSPALIVLNNVPAGQISAAAQDRLEEYVRDLGGSLLILGGDSAFGRGGYDGTILDALSPLASSPPNPQNLWIIVVDGSGSMSQNNRWQQATSAVVHLLPFLPANDPLRIGQFSDSLRWWSDGLTAGQTSRLSLPPADALPHGPTNLEPVLQSIVRDAPRSMPTQLLLLTDAETQIDDPVVLTKNLNTAHVHLNLLAIDRGNGLGVLEKIVHDTDGSFVTQTDGDQWALSARQILSAALPDRLESTSALIRFIGPVTNISGGSFSPWNRTWLKRDAAEWAESDSLPMAASWRFGLGQVTSVAFAPNSAQIEALATALARPPADPRLQVRWQTGPTLRVSVDAADGGEYLNDLNLSLQIDSSRQLIPQTGPGEYELSASSPPTPQIATVWLNDMLVDRIALAGWYDAKFAAVGEDRAALELLAKRSGGRVILPSEKTPIEFHRLAKIWDLTPIMALGAAICIASGLIAFRRSSADSAKQLSKFPPGR